MPVRTWVPAALALLLAACQPEATTEPAGRPARDEAGGPPAYQVRPDQQYLMDRFDVPAELLGIPGIGGPQPLAPSAAKAGISPREGLSLAVAGNTGVTVVGKPAGTREAYPIDVNRDGTMVGYAYPVDGGNYRIYKWSGAGSVELTAPDGGFYPWANAINDAGQVAGYAYLDLGNGSRYTPIVWSADGTPTVLSTPDAGADYYHEAYATDLNAGGEVVGFQYQYLLTSGAYQYVPLLWRGSTVTVLPQASGSFTYPEGINDAGIIAANADGRAHRYTGGAWSELPLPVGFTYAYTRGVAPNGDVIGTADGNSGRHVVRWRADGAVEVMEIPAGFYEYTADPARGAGAGGRAAGTLYRYHENGGCCDAVPFVWDENDITVLAKWDPSPGWSSHPLAISNGSVIAGYGLHSAFQYPEYVSPLLWAPAFGPADADADGVADEDDNCPTATNPDQTDEDADGVGDACEVQEAQTISFDALAGRTFGDPDFTVAATTTSGLDVSFTAAGGCTVSDATVRITAAGECTVTAHQAGSTSYSPAEDVVRAFAVAQATPVIQWSSPAPIAVGTALSTTQLNATAIGVGSIGLTGNFVYTPAAGTVLGAGPGRQLSVIFTPADPNYRHTSQSVSLAVLYRFAGFFQPVDNPAVVNTAKAGRAIPVKFSLGGNQGMDILQSGSPTAGTFSCSASAAEDVIEETVAASNSGLTYDAASSQYNYVWKTETGYANSCRKLTLTLKDGTRREALFHFVK